MVEPIGNSVLLKIYNVKKKDVLTNKAKNKKKHTKQKFLYSMLKVFSIFMMKFYYKEDNTMKVIGTRCINFKRLVGCELKDTRLSKVINIFKTVVFQHVGISCIV